MKIKSLLAGLAALAFTAAAPVVVPASLPLGATPAQAQQASISFSVFFNDLTDGQWVENSDYNYVFCPDVDSGWAPYTRGHWIYLKNSGWYFASDEPFAWAVYHYGRWFQDADLGWCWVPGTIWAPAWVTWRRSNDYVGWAPLPPEGHGYSIHVSVAAASVPERDWVFVPTRSFLQPQLSTVVVLADQHPDVYRRTRDVGPVIVQNNTVVNTVININVIEQQTNQKVQVVTPRRVSDPKQLKASTAGGTQAGAVAVFEAKVQAPKQDAKPPHAVKPQQAAQTRRANVQNAGQSGQNTNAQAAGGSQTNANGSQTNASGHLSAQGGNASQSGQPSSQAKASQKAAPAKQNCPPDQVKNGVCVPKARTPSSPNQSSKAGASTNGQQSGKTQAPAASVQGKAGTQSGSSAQGSAGPRYKATKPASGPAQTRAGSTAGKSAPTQLGAKPSAKAPAANKPVQCPADEKLVNGRCVPSGASKPRASSNERPRSSSGAQAGGNADRGANGGAMQAAPGVQPKASSAGGAGAAAEPGASANAHGQAAPAQGRAQPKARQCPAGETLVHGVCARPGASGGNGSGNGGRSQGGGSQ